MTLPDATPPLTAEEAETAFAAILDGQVDASAIASFLTELSDRGETAVEIAAAARTMRTRMLRVIAPPGAIDVCGTGGDGHHTLNISTAVALVVAACGVPVAKHGNRAASSRSGAADTLEALGLDLARAATSAEDTLGALGICFLFAQNHHPALAHMAPIRRAMGRRTIFNLLGPLANPAGVSRQLIGVADPDLVPIYAEALTTLGTEHALVVSGDEGLDELSLAGGNRVATVSYQGISTAHWTAAEAGLDTHPLEAIRGGDAPHNAIALHALLLGERDAYREAVLFNTAAALIVADQVKNLRAGVHAAAEAIDTRRAKALLDRWIAW